MPLYSINFEVSTNEDWVDTLQFQEGSEGSETPVDLTGTSFLMHIRRTPTQLAEDLVLSTANGRLIIEPAPEDAGKLSVYVPKDTVNDLTPGPYVFDLIWTMSDGREVNLAAGSLTVNLGITR